MTISVFGWVENIVGKIKNAGTCKKHFLLFQPCFQRSRYSGGRYKSSLCGKDLNALEGFSLTIFYFRATESPDQDQIACICKPLLFLHSPLAEPHSSVGSVAYMRTGCR